MKIILRKNQRGFVALFAVLVSSILLIMALSIAGVAYKEQLLSINAKASQYSFTAADTGMECALYWDVNREWYSSGNSPTDPAIRCGGLQPPIYLPDISTGNFHVYKLEVNSNVNGQTLPGCAVYTIDKLYDDNQDNVPESTKIDSRGYNVNCNNIDYGLGGIGDLQFTNGAGGRAVERFLSAIYLNGN